MIWILAVIFLGSAGLRARTPNLPAQIDEIRALLEPDDSDSQQAKMLKAELRQYPDNWQQLLEDDRLTELARSRVNVDLTQLPEVATKIADLLQDAKAESIRREAAKIAKAEAMLDHIGGTLKTAQKPEELDALMSAINKTKFTDYEASRKLGSLARDLQNSLSIVSSWQDYLFAKEAGNANEVRSHLEHITQQLTNTPLVERSFVLRLLKAQGPKSADASASSGSDSRVSLDDIQNQMAETGDSAAALAALKAIPRNQLERSDNSYFLRAVQSVEDLRKLAPTMADSEVFANLRNLANSQSSRYSTAKALEQIALTTIARSYGMDPPDAKSTTARKVLESIATTASKEGDLPKLRKTINFLDNFSGGPNPSDSQKRAADLKIISLIELAAAAEQHHDLDAAAAAYLEASSIDGQFIQRETPYLKLAALKEKFPDKIGPLLTKAEENRVRMEAARVAAETEARNMMIPRPGNLGDRATLRPLVEEVVADFLKQKRLDETKKSDQPAKPAKESE